MTLAEQVASVEADITATKALVASLQAEHEALAPQRLTHDADAVAKSAELRDGLAEAQQRLADLDVALAQAKHFAAIEGEAQSLAREHEHWRKFLDLVEAHERAARHLDDLVVDVAAAVSVYDKLGSRIFADATVLVGSSSAALAPHPVHEEVTGLLVKYGAVERHLLPPRYVGEIGHISPIARGAALKAAMARRLAPADLVRDVAA